MTGSWAVADQALDQPDECLDTACRLLLARNAPVSLDELAAALGADLAPVAAAIDAHERRGRIGRDADGMVVASAGVSVVPSGYELHIAARVMWAWCANTALGVTSALGLGGVILSRSPYSGADLRTRFSGSRPAPGTTGAVLWPSAAFRDSCQSAASAYCPALGLFEDAAAARAWAAANKVPGEVLTVEEATGRAARRWRGSLDMAGTGAGLAAALAEPPSG